MRRLSMKIAFGAATVAMVAVLAWTFAARSQKGGEKREKEQSKQTAMRAGEPSVTLDSETQAHLGIRVTTLLRSSHREEVFAPATVLSAQELIDLRNSYLAATAKMQKTRLSVDVSQKEYDRLHALYQDNQNTSQRSLQAAEATLRSNEVDVQAAEQELRFVEGTARQRWGDVVATWLSKGSPHFDPLFQQSGFLIQVTLPANERVSPEQSVTLETSPGELVPAEFVSRFPRVDPRIQGLSLLYLTTSRDGLSPGMNLTARLPVGARASGVVVQESAVVWWQGKGWAYVQVDRNVFVRREVPTQLAVPKGWFVARGFAPGEKVVVTGAQALLSAELRPQAPAEEKERGERKEKD
jgi:hypothetical protein